MWPFADLVFADDIRTHNITFTEGDFEDDENFHGIQEVTARAEDVTADSYRLCFFDGDGARLSEVPEFLGVHEGPHTGELVPPVGGGYSLSKRRDYTMLSSWRESWDLRGVYPGRNVPFGRAPVRFDADGAGGLTGVIEPADATLCLLYYEGPDGERVAAPPPEAWPVFRAKGDGVLRLARPDGAFVLSRSASYVVGPGTGAGERRLFGDL